MNLTIYFVLEEKFIATTCLIVDKAYQNFQKLGILLPNKEVLTEFDKALWTFASLKFIPHLTEFDEDHREAPILLVNEADKINNFENVILINTANLSDFLPLKNLILIVSDANLDELQNVKNIEDKAKNEGVSVKKFRQVAESGKWEQLV